jgi:hypothetical protein
MIHPFINLWVVCLLKSWYPILDVLFTKYCNPGYLYTTYHKVYQYCFAIPVLHQLIVFRELY